MKPVTENELAAKAVGRRVTLADVEGSILTENYFSAADGVDGADLSKSRMCAPAEKFCYIPLAHDNPIPAGSPMACLSLLTFCVLVLKNGFTIVGQSACADPSNFNPEIGQRLARADAVNKIWAFLGFELRTELSKAAPAPAAVKESDHWTE